MFRQTHSPADLFIERHTDALLALCQLLGNGDPLDLRGVFFLLCAGAWFSARWHCAHVIRKTPAYKPHNSKKSDARRSAPTGSCAERGLANGQAHLLEGLQVRVAALGHGALEPTDQVELTQRLVGRAVEHDLEGGR